MKFDPYQWNEVRHGEKIQAGPGVLRMRCSQAAPLYIEAEGFEALAGVGTDFQVEVSEPVTARFDAPKTARVFVQRPSEATAVEPIGEVFTNIDRMTQESGTMLEVRRALRQLELERRAALRDIRQASKAAEPKVIETEPKPAVEEAQTTPLSEAATTAEEPK